MVQQQAQPPESSPRACLRGHCWHTLPHSRPAPGFSASLPAQLVRIRMCRHYHVPRTTAGNLVTSPSLHFLICKMDTIMVVNQDTVLLADQTKKAECLLMPVQNCRFFSPYSFQFIMVTSLRSMHFKLCFSPILPFL